MRYTSILKNKFFLILSILLLATPSLAQSEDTTTIEEKKREALQDEEQEEDSWELLQPEIDIEQKTINIEFPHIEILKEMNNQKLLLPLLRDETPGIRAEAARALGEIGDQGVISPLGKSLKKDKSPYVRYHAAWALGKIGGKESLSTLRKALKREKDWWVKKIIEKSIKKIESDHFINPEVGYQNFLRRGKK